MATTGDRAHRGEHAQIFYLAGFELFDTIRSRAFSRSIAIASAIIQIRQPAIKVSRAGCARIPPRHPSAKRLISDLTRI
ncbi:hypothetical protein [Candidatus Binatus sp.]|jgi:hypothetical protein|uniref:hypothetical protein n=1 Tax=Candidatus Binatus sp. TaxID=2811406 RepID=UPI002FD89B21